MKSKTLVGLVGSVLIPLTGALNSGCYPYVDNSIYAHSFTYNYFQDKNRNSIAEPGEFIGIGKKKFHSYEKIGIGNYFINKARANVKSLVRNSRGKIVYEHEFIIPFNNAFFIHEFMPQRLKELGGIGDYTVEWYLEGNLVDISKFILLD